MKGKILLIIFILIFILNIYSDDKVIVTNVSSHLYYNDNQVSSDNLKKVEDVNDDLFERIKQLEELAENYISDRNISANKTELCLQYLRRNRYNSEKWSGLLGPVDGDFVDYVKKNGNGLKFSNNEIIYDVKTNRGIDFIHMSAVLNSYVRYGNTISLIFTDLSTDYAGWAGDSLMFLEEMVNYRIKNTSSEDVLANEDEEVKQLRNEKYLKYVISYIGTNKNSTMSGPDILADFDAYNIFCDKSLNVNESFYGAIVKYYDSYDCINNSLNRFEVLQNKFGNTEEVISNYVRPYLTNEVVRKMFIPDTSDKVTNEDIDVFLKGFSKYIMEELYVDIESYNKDSSVGKEIKLKVTENHLNFPKVMVVPENLATAFFSGEYLVIIPKQAGNVEITVSSISGIVYKNFKFKINNIKPNIEVGLDSNYYFDEYENASISIDASGTNNIYTWYVSNVKNGDYTVLSETTTPYYSFSANKKMDAKFIKCGIKNEGHDEIFSNIAVIHVASSKGVVLSTNDNNYVIYLIIIMIIIVIFMFIFFKLKINNKN